MSRNGIVPLFGGNRRRGEYLDELGARTSIGADPQAELYSAVKNGGLSREALAAAVREMMRTGEGVPYERSGPLGISSSAAIAAGATSVVSVTTQRTIKTAGFMVQRPIGTEVFMLTSIKFGADELLPASSQVPAQMFEAAGTLNDFTKGRVLQAGQSIFITVANVGAAGGFFYGAFAVDSD